MTSTLDKKIDTVEQPITVDVSQNAVDDFEAEYSNGSSLSSVMHGVINILCGILGAGIVGLPQALARESWYLGLVLLVVCGLFSGYAAVLLSRCADVIIRTGKSKESISYAELGENAFGKWGRYVTIGSQLGQSLGGAILYLLLGAQMAADLVHWEFQYLVLCCAGVVLPFCLLRTFKEVSFIALFGMLASILIMFVVCIEAFTNINEEFLDENYPRNANGDRNITYGNTSFESIAVGFGTLAFAFGGHGIFIRIKCTMERPSLFPISVMIAFGSCIAFYIPTSVINYWRYGDALIDSDGNILDILPTSPGKYIAQICLVIHVLIAYVVFLNPIFLYAELWCFPISKKIPGGAPYLIFNSAVRIFIVGFTVFVVEALPFFSYLQSFIGATSCVLLGYILPCLFHMKMLNVGKKEKILNIFMVIFGSVAGILAAYYAVKGIVESASSFTTYL
eukprot:Nk52_evm32s355 gene=Nk52_evmTU32s355